MAELLDWWNDATTAWSPVITSAILHYRFEDIHPFADGNGRVGRTLALWELYRRGFDTHHIFAVDDVYWEKRSRYYAALDAVRQHGGNLTSWIEYVAEAVQLTLDRVWVRVQRLSASQGALDLIKPLMKAGLVRRIGTRKSGRYLLT